MLSRGVWLAAIAALCCWSDTIFTSAMAAPARPKQPVYVGAKVCAECHDGVHMGNQFNIWLQSRHSGAFTSLAMPEARQIARWSGIPVEPQQSVYCLGCHATAAEAEPWERDASFFIKDGIQCEKCHGPGSEYADEKVMTNREAAIRAGLNIPTKDFCVNCHVEKGSHRIVLGPNKFNLDEAWNRIAHPTPKDWQLEGRQPVAKPQPNDAAGAKYTGSAACSECHYGSDKGYQFSKWRDSAHSSAYAKLGTAEALDIAAKAGVKDDPRQSAACLKCHATAYRDAAGYLDTYADYEGVGCEACHGPGSDHSDEVTARKNPQIALKVALKKSTRDDCMVCHADAHGKPFDYDAAWKKIAHPNVPPAVEAEPTYKSPLNISQRPGTQELYVTCNTSNSVVVVDAAAGKSVGEIPVGGQPIDVAFTDDGARAFVSNRLDDSVSVIDAQTRKVTATIPVGDEPHGVLVDSARKHLYVLNTSSDTIAVIDIESLKPIKRLAAGRSPWDLAMSADGQRIFVSNMYSNFVPFHSPSVSEVSVLDAEQVAADSRPLLNGANLIQGVATHPSGRFTLVTLLRTKNLVPMTRTLQGWTITNGLGVVWADGRVDQVLLDQPGLYFADPAAIAITPDGKWALVASSSTDRVAVVDVEKLISMLEKATPKDREQIIPNHLGKSSEFVVGMISTGVCPRGLLITPDGKTAYIANTLDDSLSVIDIARRETVGRIDLGGPKVITQVRFGDRLFHSANITFRRQFSCSSCHPDGHIDKITYDTEPDGIGVDPVDNKTLRGILDTAPFKWNGKNPTFSRQCGARLSCFFTRIQPFNPEELAALDLFVCTIPRPPNYFRPLGAPLTDTQSRGRTIFTRIMTNDGRVIPAEKRCTTCHFPPLYTDRRLHDVGTMMAHDTSGVFDTPHLSNIYDSAPYLHNGIAHSLEEIWTRYNPKDTHGITNDMTKDQLNDLVEYLKTL